MRSFDFGLGRPSDFMILFKADGIIFLFKNADIFFKMGWGLVVRSS